MPQAREAAERAHPDREVIVLFQDEMRTGQQGTLTRIWGERGERVSAPRQTEYEWTYLFGAACPQTGEAVGLILPYADTSAMKLFWEATSRLVGPQRQGLLVLDQAGWHHSRRLRIPENLTLVFLPPYSPELNPVERIWAYLRSHGLANRVYADYDELVEAVAEGWREFVSNPDRVRSVCRVSYLK